MNNKLDRYLISLEEPVGLLQERFRDRAIAIITKDRNSVAKQTPYLNYNYTPYMNLLLKEIFEFKSISDDAKNVNNGICKSTGILISAGLDKKDAMALALEVLHSTIDAVSVVVPNLKFNAMESYQYGMCEPHDVLITIPNYGDT